MASAKAELLDSVIPLIKEYYDILVEAGSGTRRERFYGYTDATCTEDKANANSDGQIRYSYSCTVTADVDESIDETYADMLCQPGSPLTEMLGHGCYAAVLGCRDPKYAVKIGLGRGNDGDIWGDGWLEYAAFCLNSEPMLGKPKIHGIRVFPDSGFYIALLDKYVSPVGDMENFDYSTEEYYSAYNRMCALRAGVNPNWDCADQDHVNKFRHYYQAGVILGKGLNKWRGDSGGWDLHDWNFMVDNRKRIIMTDPTACTCTRKTRDYFTRIKEAA